MRKYETVHLIGGPKDGITMSCPCENDHLQIPIMGPVAVGDDAYSSVTDFGYKRLRGTRAFIYDQLGSFEVMMAVFIWLKEHIHEKD